MNTRNRHNKTTIQAPTTIPLVPISAITNQQQQDTTVHREDTVPLDERQINDYMDVETTVLSGEAKDGGDLVTLVVADIRGSGSHN